MKKITIYEYPETLISYMVENGIPFEIERTSSQMKLTSEIENAIYSKLNKSDFPQREMWFFNYLKKNISNPPKYDAQTLKSDSTFIGFNDDFFKANKTLKNYVEVDINGAYWKSALWQNFITEEVYNIGLSVSKKVRLASLGALAKSPLIQKFDGKKFNTQKQPYPETAKYFFALTNHVSETIDFVLNKIDYNKFAFFWVDALFIHESIEQDVKSLFLECGFECKTKAIDSIKFNSDTRTIKTEYTAKKGNKNSKLYQFNKEIEFLITIPEKIKKNK